MTAPTSICKLRAGRSLGLFLVLLVLAWPRLALCTPAISYGYDALNRLTQVSYADGSTITYTYDAAGNRVALVEFLVTPTETPTIAPTPTQTPASTILFGGQFGFTYNPSQVTIAVGDTVEWQGDFSFHPLVSDDSLWPVHNSGVVFRFTFDSPGTFLYHCQNHGGPNGLGMAGRVIVVSSVTDTPTATPTAEATAIFTLTPTESPTPTPAPTLMLFAAAARPGGLACVPVMLLGNASPVAVSNSIAADPNYFTFASATINPAIGANTAPDEQLIHQSTELGNEQFEVSGSNDVVIPDGLLYTATFTVGLNVSAGTYPISGTPGGQIVVTNCTGDCNGNGQVTIGEVTKCVNLFLGQPLCNASNPLVNCPVADASLNGTVSIGEVTQCVNRFLGGCS